MAKKKTAGKNGRKRGMPEKECPQCHAKQHARKAVCDNCGFHFPQKPPKAKRGKGKAATGPVRAAARAARSSELLAMEFVLFSQQGDIAKAVEAVESYEYSKLAEFIDAAGGKQRAASALATIKEKAKS